MEPILALQASMPVFIQTLQWEKTYKCPWTLPQMLQNQSKQNTGELA